MSVTVRVPATIANLGPGFDCLGCAVQWHSRMALEESNTTSIEVSGPGEDRIPRDETNLVLRAVRAVEAAAGAEPRQWAIRIQNEAPYGRGFGSSAAAIVGGAVAAGALLSDPVDAGLDLLSIAGRIEGHLDNVSAALLGGFTVSGYAAGDALRIEPPPGLAVLACVAAERLSTSKARDALPEQVPFNDAVFTASRAALLAACLVSGDTQRLMEATEDRLHQERRFELAPSTGELVAALRGAGIAAFLSGAGPSVAAFVTQSDAQRAERIARDAVPAGWQARMLAFDTAGAVVERR